MPIYAFQCQACGHAFERLQKLSDADPTACPDCGAEQVRRQLTAPTFRLAGGGWYETDFKKDGKRNLAEKGEGGGAGEGGKDAAKADAKPADAKPADSKPTEAKPATPATPAPAKPSTGSAT
jgi:putative FmdB family regulatory protein